MGINIEELQKLMDRSHEKQTATEYVIDGLKDQVGKLQASQCKGESCPNRIKVGELEKQLAEKPKKEIVHHKIPPWGENCPDCDFENPYPVPKEKIKTGDVCTNCKSPVLEDWSECPECHEEL